MDSRTKCLLDWFATLPTFKNETSPPGPEIFKDGAMLGRILREVIDPSYFHELNDPTLVEAVEMMKKYLSVQIGHQMPTHLKPNAGRIISTRDIREVGRLIQLLLGCAVNCPGRETFVTKIMKMEDSAQIVIKEAIEEILRKEERQDVFLPDNEYNISSRIASLQETIDELSQKNHELKGKLSHMEEEKLTLATENDKLISQLSSHLNDPESIHMTLKYQEETKKEVERLREENFKLEGSLDDFKLRVQVLEKQLLEAHSKMLSTTRTAEDIVSLKDEVDILREAAAKVPQLEARIKNYLKKFEEMTYLKSNMKALEDKNEELNKSNIHLEDELKKVGGMKAQVDGVKKELAETQQRLSQETQRALKAEFDCRLLREKNETAQKEASRLLEEKTRLGEQLEEMRLSSDNDRADNMSNIPPGNGVDSIELLPPLVRERIRRLELENKKLNEKLNASIAIGGAGEGSKVLVEQLRKHETELDEQLLTKTQELLESEEKNRRLEALLLEKEEELKKKKNQYDKCMDKAKSVIVSLEPTAPAALDMNKTDSEKDKAIAIREREEKLMASMFYNLSLQLHRNGVEARNSTFLQRHRHPPNPSQPRRKSEM